MSTGADRPTWVSLSWNGRPVVGRLVAWQVVAMQAHPVIQVTGTDTPYVYPDQVITVGPDTPITTFATSPTAEAAWSAACNLAAEELRQ